MKILVTGGCGFIGSRLVDKLIELGHEVVVLDNFSAGKKEANKRAKIIEGDVRDNMDVSRAIKDCSVIFHLAALTDARDTDEDAIFQTNVIGSKNVFQAAKATNTKVVFVSSAAVYGNTALPNMEDGECKPLSQYGKSKLNAEHYLNQNYSGNSFVVRLFNVYGPKSKSAINKFCRKITNFEDVIVYGNGMQTRDYVYIDDVVSALLLGLDNTGLYNVGTGQDIAVTTLIEKIHEITRCKPTIKSEAPNSREIVRSRADITKIRNLGWAPTVNMEDGLKLILDSIGFKKMV